MRFAIICAALTNVPQIQWCKRQAISNLDAVWMWGKAQKTGAVSGANQMQYYGMCHGGFSTN